MAKDGKQFNVGDIVSVEGFEFKVTGIISYSSGWYEYYLESTTNSNDDMWLEVDGDRYTKYAFLSDPDVDLSGYEEVENTVEYVYSTEGTVDVENGDKVENHLYLNPTTQCYISREVWEDETEVCEGFVIGSYEVQLVKKASLFSRIKGKLLVWAFIIGVAVSLSFCDDAGESSVDVDEFLSNTFSIGTYITGSNSNSSSSSASVYLSYGNTVDYVAMMIITGTDGAFTSFESLADTSAVIMSNDNELCLVYRDTVDDAVAIHYSSRNFAYNNLNDPLYNASEHVENFYRSYYVEKCLDSDSSAYYDGSSHHRYRSHYGYGFYYFNLGSNDRYRSYSESVRQSSASRRRSGGGGHGGGGK